jgi:hypothetical protein
MQHSLAKLQASAGATQPHSTAPHCHLGTASTLGQSAAANGPALGEWQASSAAANFQMQQSGTSVGTLDKGQHASSVTGFSMPGSMAALEDGGTALKSRRRHTRKTQSSCLLSQRLIQLFLSTSSAAIALGDAAVALRGMALRRLRHDGPVKCQ